MGVKERFNENFDYVASLKNKKVDQALSSYSKGPASSYKGEGQVAPQVRAQSSYFKKRILDKINMMDDKELERMGLNLDIDDQDE